jgi:hypothetical protein
MINFEKCWSGRRWINIGTGLLAIGFGPDRFIERIVINKKMVYVNRRAVEEHRRKVIS